MGKYIPRRDNTGVLFFTPHKKRKPTDPDWRGDVQIEGNVYKILGWQQLDKNSSDYLSISVVKMNDLQRAQYKGNDVLQTAKPKPISYDPPQTLVARRRRTT